MCDEEKTCELCGLPITDDEYHDGEDGEMYHAECCPGCNGAEWKRELEEARARIAELENMLAAAYQRNNVRDADAFDGWAR